MLNIHFLIALLWLAAGTIWFFGSSPITGLTAAISAFCAAMAVLKFLIAWRQRQNQQKGTVSDE